MLKLKTKGYSDHLPSLCKGILYIYVLLEKKSFLALLLILFFDKLIYAFEYVRLRGMVVSMSGCQPGGHGFDDSRLYPEHFSVSIGSGTGRRRMPAPGAPCIIQTIHSRST